MNEIYELQMMLRRIAQIDKSIEVVNALVIYVRDREKAVWVLLELYVLPVSVRVVGASWDILTAFFTLAVGKITGGGEPLYIFPNAKYQIRAGEISDIVIAVQVILNAISHAYDDYGHIVPSGVYNTETQDAITHFQGINRLPQTGIVDSKTWDALAQSYNSFANNPYYES